MPHVFFDVNVYIDAVIFWNSGNEPTQIIFDTGTGLNGPPAALLWIAIRDRSVVHGEPITLHSSDHVLEQVSANPRLQVQLGQRRHRPSPERRLQPG